MNNQEEKVTRGPTSSIIALSLARFVTQPMTIISGLLLIDIANSFNISVGIAGQIRTIAAFSEMIFGLIMGLLAVRYRYKRLLLTGLFLITLSSIGSSLAPNLTLLMILYPLSGIGIAMIGPMTLTLVGEYFPVEKRTYIVGLMVGILAASYTIGAPIVSYISGNGDWRLPMRWYAFPLASTAFIATLLLIPNRKEQENMIHNNNDFFSGYRILLSEKSALACLLGGALYMAAQVIPLSFGSSYLRQIVGVSTIIAALAVILNSFSYIIGSLVSGKIIGALGGKRTAWVCALVMSSFYFIAYSSTSLPLVVVFSVCGYLFGGVLYATSNSLAVEQVPSIRATMMSAFIAIVALGNTIGNTVGGFSLVSYGYSSLRFVLVIFGATCAVINAVFISK